LAFPSHGLISAIDAYIGAGGSHQMMLDDPVTLAEYFRIDPPTSTGR
jgi:hypothetical protein